jgi:hypothetical protein
MVVDTADAVKVYFRATLGDQRGVCETMRNGYKARRLGHQSSITAAKMKAQMLK